MKITTKHASNSPVTFVTLKRFAVLLFDLPAPTTKHSKVTGSKTLNFLPKWQKIPEHFLYELLYTVNCWVSSSFKQIFWLETKKHWYLVKITTKHASNSPVTFVTHKRFAVPLFLPSCCVNSLIMPITRPYSLWNLNNYLSITNHSFVPNNTSPKHYIRR